MTDYQELLALWIERHKGAMAEVRRLQRENEELRRELDLVWRLGVESVEAKQAREWREAQ